MEEKKDKPGAKKKEATPFFREMVKVYFDFYEKEFGEEPSFDGSAPRDLKCILDAMRKRSADKGFTWTQMLSTAMLSRFLQEAAKDQWLGNNFLLYNLNRQKDKLFLAIKNNADGKSNSETPGRKYGGSVKTAGQEIFAERLRKGLEGLQ